MALEAVSAIGFAANILQFIDFSWDLIANAKEIYHSAKGVTTQNIELQGIADSLSRLSLSLAKPPRHPSNDSLQLEQEIQNSAKSCKAVADELLTVVQDLQVKEGVHRKWHSFRQALNTVWKKDKISRLQKRLEEVRNHLAIQILSHIR